MARQTFCELTQCLQTLLNLSHIDTIMAPLIQVQTAFLNSERMTLCNYRAERNASNNPSS